MTSSSATTIEPLYVVDTHALIWYLKGDRKLSSVGRKIFEAAKRHETRLLISAITIAEMYYADQRHQLFADFKQIYQNLRSESYLEIVDFNADDVLEFDLDKVVPEMHDRIIAGLARWLEVPLLTHDATITASNLVTIVW